MRVMMFARAAKQTEASQPPTEEELLAMHTFNEELRKAGVLVDLGGFLPANRSVRVKYRGSKRTVTDGPFAGAQDAICGYTLLEVKTMAEAGEAEERAKRLGE